MEFRRNFAEFFPGIQPELSYGIPYCTEFRNIRNSVKRNSAFLRNSAVYGILYWGNSVYTEFRNAELRILRNSICYGIPYRYGIFTEFRQNSVFRIMNSVKKKFRRNFFDGIMDTIKSQCSCPNDNILKLNKWHSTLHEGNSTYKSSSDYKPLK